MIYIVLPFDKGRYIQSLKQLVKAPQVPSEFTSEIVVLNRTVFLWFSFLICPKYVKKIIAIESLVSNLYFLTKILRHSNDAFWFSDLPIKPTLTINPSTNVIQSGNIVTLTCVSSNTGVSSYKFNLNGQLLSEIASNTFTLSNVTPQNSGQYSCQTVVNGATSVNSDAAALVVQGKKKIFSFFLASDSLITFHYCSFEITT